MSMNPGMNVNEQLSQYIIKRISEFDQISDERKQKLREIADFVSTRTSENEIAKLTFICTHNSRRSHMGQIWALTAAYFYGLGNVETYSGGTEATAFNPRAVKALEDSGFQINTSDGLKNPVYRVNYASGVPPINAYSKKYDSDSNPGKDFCAVMTCSQADAECPFIPGAILRIVVPYEDPKNYDGTIRETDAYSERCEQIAREMLYIASIVKK